MVQCHSRLTTIVIPTKVGIQLGVKGVWMPIQSV
jgi:hypothetical protein